MSILRIENDPFGSNSPGSCTVSMPSWFIMPGNVVTGSTSIMDSDSFSGVSILIAVGRLDRNTVKRSRMKRARALIDANTNSPGLVSST